MVEREITVSNRLGLHARAAAKLVQLAGRFPARVSLVCRGREVNAQSILGVMMLAAGKGASIAIVAEGEGAEAALAALQKLIADRFDEGE